MGKDDYPKSTFMESSYTRNSFHDFNEIIGLNVLKLKVMLCIDRSENKMGPHNLQHAYSNGRWGPVEVEVEGQAEPW